MVWFTPETFSRLPGVVPAGPTAANDVVRRKAAEQAIEDSGLGNCMYCKEEIMKNKTLNHWESDFLLDYCYEAKDHKHRPLVRYSPNEGVTNVERNDQTYPEPLPD